MDHVLVTISWNNQNLERHSDNYNASLLFNPLQKQDSGLYVCNIQVHSRADFDTHIISGMNSSMLNISLIGRE